MDMAERKKVKPEMKELEQALKTADDIQADMTDMCIEIGNVGASFKDIDDSDRDYILSHMDKASDGVDIAFDMIEYMDKYYCVLGWWKDDVYALSYNEFRNVYKKAMKLYDKLCDVYDQVYDMYNTLVKNRYVPSKRKIRY